MRGVTERTRELIVSSTFAEPGGVLISVEDTGAGLDPVVAQRIYEPFFTTKSEGLGMGLSICRSIVEGHRGRLWVSPRIPHGAVIHFTVPARAGAIAPPPAPLPRSRVQTGLHHLANWRRRPYGRTVLRREKGTSHQFNRTPTAPPWPCVANWS